LTSIKAVVGCNSRARDREALRYEPALPQRDFGSPPAAAPNPGQCFRRDTIRRRRLGWRREYSPRVGNGWRYLTNPVGFGLSVWLADRVVPWHNFNLVGFGTVNLQACHSKYQGSRRQAETLSLDRGCIDLLGQALTFAWKCHHRSLSKARDEKSHICCRAASEARSSIERNCRKPAAVESLHQTCAEASV